MLFALGVQPAARPRRPAVVRPRRVLRRRRLRVRAGGQSTSRRTSGSTSARRWRAAALAGALGRGVHLAPARHLLRPADDRVRPGVLVRRDQVAQRHRRRGRAAQHQAPAGRSRRREWSLAATKRSSTSRSRCSCWSSSFLWRLVHSPFGRVLRAVKQNEMRAPFLRPQRLALQVARVRALGGGRRARRRTVRDGAAVGLSERDEPAQVRVRRDDGADRRRARQLLGAGDRRGVLHPRARPARRVHRDLAALVRPAVHGDGAVQARGHRRAWRLLRQSGGAGSRRGPDGSSRPASSPALRRAVVLEDVSRSRKARWPGSWGRTAPARRPASTADRPLPARSRQCGLRRRGHHRPLARRDRPARHRALVPDHEPVRRDYGARQRDRRAAGAATSRRSGRSAPCARPLHARAAALLAAWACRQGARAGERPRLRRAARARDRRRARGRAAAPLPRRADRRHGRRGRARGWPTWSSVCASA